jgi:hypothetical protein
MPQQLTHIDELPSNILNVSSGPVEPELVYVRKDRLEALRKVADAARVFFSQPYDNGQWERRLRDAVRALESNGEPSGEKR